MFKRKHTQFEITEHPDVIKALNAMWDAAYQAGRADTLAIVRDLRDEASLAATIVDEVANRYGRAPSEALVAWQLGMDLVIGRLES
jgi:hypothetical protein